MLNATPLPVIAWRKAFAKWHMLLEVVLSMSNPDQVRPHFLEWLPRIKKKTTTSYGFTADLDKPLMSDQGFSNNGCDYLEPQNPFPPA